MKATLDHDRSNRSRKISYEMTRYCGGPAEVRTRASNRLIHEARVDMRDIHNTVTLQNQSSKRGMLLDSECLCYDEWGDCPRRTDVLAENIARASVWR